MKKFLNDTGLELVKPTWSAGEVGVLFIVLILGDLDNHNWRMVAISVPPLLAVVWLMVKHKIARWVVNERLSAPEWKRCLTEGWEAGFKYGVAVGRKRAECEKIAS